MYSVIPLDIQRFRRQVFKSSFTLSDKIGGPFSVHSILSLLYPEVIEIRAAFCHCRWNHIEKLCQGRSNRSRETPYELIVSYMHTTLIMQRLLQR